jgi:hypothetical protein
MHAFYVINLCLNLYVRQCWEGAWNDTFRKCCLSAGAAAGNGVLSWTMRVPKRVSWGAGLWWRSHGTVLWSRDKTCCHFTISNKMAEMCVACCSQRAHWMSNIPYVPASMCFSVGVNVEPLCDAVSLKWGITYNCPLSVNLLAPTALGQPK